MFAFKNQENIQTLKSILKTAEETNGIAIDTNVELHAQGEKLTNIDKTTSKINVKLEQIEDQSKELSSFWYRLKNKVKKILGIKKSYQIQEKEQVSASEAEERQSIRVVIKTDTTGDISANEEDEILDEIIQKIRQVKNHSTEMGSELDRQNNLLGKIDGKMEKASTKTEKVNRILKKILY